MSDINHLDAFPPTPGAAELQGSPFAASKYPLTGEIGGDEVGGDEVGGDEVEERVDVGDSESEEKSEPSTTHTSSDEPGTAPSSTSVLPLRSVVTPLEHPLVALLRLLYPEITWTPPPTLGSSRRHQPDIRQHTPLTQVGNARNGFLFAEDKLGTPLNTFLNINFNRHGRHWKKGDRSPEQVPHVRDKILKTLTDWCENHGVDPTWVYSIENPRQGGHGPHIHILMHLPSDRWADLTTSLADCLRKSMRWSQKELEELKAKIQAQGSGIGSCDGVWLPFVISPSESHPGHPLTDQERLKRLRYLCKSVDPLAVVEMGGKRQTLEDHAGQALHPYITLREGGDPRTTKRLGTSRNLGIQERNDRGWVEEVDFGWLSRKVSRDRQIADGMSRVKSSEQDKVPPPPENQDPPIEPVDPW